MDSNSNESDGYSYDEDENSKISDTGRDIKNTSDYLMDCPYCGRYQAMEKCDYGFKCLYRDCSESISYSEVEEAKTNILAEILKMPIETIKLIKKYL